MNPRRTILDDKDHSDIAAIILDENDNRFNDAK
jgi:hypothetical protein